MLDIKNDYLHLSSELENIPQFSANAAAAICFIEAESKILLLKNIRELKDYPRDWGIPGGKLEKDELPIDAVQREIFEETSIYIPKDKLQFLLKLFVRIPKYDYELYVYKSVLTKKIEDIEIKLDTREHSAYVWKTVAEAMQLPLIYEDQGLIEYIYRQQWRAEIY